MNPSISTGTVPLTIAQAIEACRYISRHHAIDQSGHPPVDLLAVVASVEASDNQQASFVRLWVQDASITTTRNVQIVCFGQRRYNDLIDTLQIRSGDIVRFNRITTTVPLTTSSNNQNNDNRMAFTYDNYNPETGGPEYYRFGNVFDTDDVNNNIIPTNMNFHNHRPEGYEIPMSMQTNPKCMHDLIVWYRSSINDQSSSHYCNDKVLESLPCQHRTLLEFLSCSGIFGHVTVFVVQIEQCQQPLLPTNRTRRKNSSIPHRTTKTLFVTLMDNCSSSPMAFVIDSGRTDKYPKFQSILSQAQASNQPVLLTNITSVRNQQSLRIQQNGPFLLPNSTDCFLIPTFKSDIVFVNHSLAEGNRNNAGLSPSLTPFTLPTQFECSSETSEVLVIASPILDIGMSASSGCKFSFPDGDPSLTNRNDNSIVGKLILLSMLASSSSSVNVDCNGSDDESIATIELQTNDIANEIVTVEATAAIIQCLCGSGDVDLVGRQRSEQSINDKFPIDAKHRDLQIILLKSMVDEKIKLQWMIQKIIGNKDKSNLKPTDNDVSYRVLKVWLLEF